MNGEFFILEGIDGAGKATQLGLLDNWLNSQGHTTLTVSFPQYNQFWGSMVGRFLNGEFGQLDDINPYLASLPYLLDQASQNNLIRSALEQDKIVLADRYVTSSMAHQTARFTKKSDQVTFLTWLEQAAYEDMGLIRETVTIVLDVNPQISKQLAEQSRGRKTYAKSGDLNEDHQTHLYDARDMYRQLAQEKPTWHLVECMEDKELLSVEAVHERIKKIVKNMIFHKNY